MLDIAAIRSQFPALRREVAHRQAVYADGPGGTQVPRAVIDAMSEVLTAGAGNLTSAFVTGRYSIDIVDAARQAVADLYGAASSDEIVFGQNMTSLTFAISRALARTWDPGDEIVVTDLDHDANRTPWVLAARDAGVTVRVAPFDPETFQLDMAALAEMITPRTRLVAATHASNALGTVTDVAAITDLARSVGALSYIDAVHYAPHGPLDVQSTDCDFLVASAYKFFGPHTGALYGKSEHLETLEAYKVRPSPPTGPGKWETGTQSFESLAGVTAAVDYLATLGNGSDRRGRLVSAMSATSDYESELSHQFLEGIADMAHVRLYGPPTADRRTPTFAIDVVGTSAAEVAATLGDRGIFVYDGHYYAVGVMERLGVLETGGLVRVGFVHYTTSDEVARILDELASFG